jgi:hypothetical protein
VIVNSVCCKRPDEDQRECRAVVDNADRGWLVCILHIDNRIDIGRGRRVPLLFHKDREHGWRNWWNNTSVWRDSLVEPRRSYYTRRRVSVLDSADPNPFRLHDWHYNLGRQGPDSPIHCCWCHRRDGHRSTWNPNKSAFRTSGRGHPNRPTFPRALIGVWLPFRCGWLSDVEEDNEKSICVPYGEYTRRVFESGHFDKTLKRTMHDRQGQLV